MARYDARPPSGMDVKTLKDQLVGAGVEIYRTRPAEIHVAERVRLHLMDSGIRLMVADDVRVSFTARSQLSDFPDGATPEAIFARLREMIEPVAAGRAFVETWSGTIPVKDPQDDSRVLDVWHEVTYTKTVPDGAAVVEEVQWALALERYVAPAIIPG